MTAPAGPIKPRKKPKPKKITLSDGNFVWLDAEDTLQSGVEIFVCIAEEPAEFDHLETGSYTTEEGVNFDVVNGIIQ